MRASRTAETGAILGPDERERLIPSLFTRDQVREIERLRIHAARVWAARPEVLARDDLLSAGFLRELHRRMFRGIWRDAGLFRSQRLQPGWDPAQIQDGVELFAADADGWIRFATYSVHEAAVRLHHRLLCVRPWSCGNGRHARLLADVVVAANGERPLTWGSGHAGPPSARDRYSAALALADDGDIGPLLGFARS